MKILKFKAIYLQCVACGCCTTTGLVLFMFYEENAYFLYAAMTLGELFAD